MANNEDKLELFADLIEPAAEIFSDAEISKLSDTKASKARITAALIKNHKSAVITILALLEGLEPDKYIVPGPIALAGKILKLLNDPEIVGLFTSQGQNATAVSSGSATVNTEDGAK